MFTSIILVTPKQFTGEADKNGLEPVILNVLAGKCPNRMVISGTIAQREGFELGKTYLAQVREVAIKEGREQYGRQFNFSKIAEATVMEILSASTTLGAAQLFDVNGTSSAGTTEKVVEQVIIEEDEN